MKKIYLSLLLVMAFLLNNNTANGQTVVTSNADGGPGTLRQALVDADGGAANITFNGDMLIKLDSVISIDTLALESVTIDGGDNNIVIDAQGASRIIRAFIPTNKMTVKNITFQNGGTLRGGALFLEGNNRFEGCTFQNNNSDNFGGAVYLKDTTDFINCKFINNEAYLRGGAVCIENGSGSFIGCLFDGNTVLSKGGWAFGSAITSITPTSNSYVVNCTFVNNVLGVPEGTTHPRRGGCIFYGNWGKTNTYMEPLTVVNSIFWNNEVPHQGIGSAIMLDNDATLEVYNSLLQEADISMDTLLYNVNNYPAIDFFGNANVDSSILNIENCIDGTFSGPYGNSDSTDYTHTPFTNFAAGNYTLVQELGAGVNPVVNAGITTGYGDMIPDSDVAGNDRISGTEIDLGAYEYMNIPPTLVRPVADFTVKVTDADTVLDISTVYTDPDDDDMSYELVSNSDPDVVTADMQGSDLTLSYLTAGTSDIEYSVTSGGVTMTQDFTVTVTEANAVQEPDDLNAIRVYPNPFTENIIVEFAHRENASIIITDVAGRTIMRKELESGEMINTSALNGGVYLLNLMENNRVFDTKMIIKR